MLVLTKASELLTQVSRLKKNRQSIGFVPTMGCLHAGHLALVERAGRENAQTVVSIFVNPTQFGPAEDFARYPRDFERDRKLLLTKKVDICFYPEVTEVYPPAGAVRQLKADAGLTALACGGARPGHFDGVVTVVARLFDLVQPTRAYFGLKDYQQYLVIKRMAATEQYPIEIIGCPTVRAPDGLALSSRNQYLNPEERQQAVILRKVLLSAQNNLTNVKSILEVKEGIRQDIQNINMVKIDYIEIVERNSLRPVENYKKEQLVILLAVYIGKTRLIDNILV